MANEKKSSHVKLTPQQITEMKNAIIAGDSPKSIHERLGISLANIHYHKNRMRKEGVLKAKRKSSAGSVKKATPVSQITETIRTKKSGFNLIVNETSIHIDGAASVSVGKDYIKVNY